jgi:hypothetical protein
MHSNEFSTAVCSLGLFFAFSLFDTVVHGFAGCDSQCGSDANSFDRELDKSDVIEALDESLGIIDEPSTVLSTLIIEVSCCKSSSAHP